MFINNMIYNVKGACFSLAWGVLNGHRMKTNILRTAVSAVVLAFAGLLPAYAVETLTLTDGAGNTATEVSNGSGLVTFAGAIGNWNLNLSAGITMPIIGSPTSPAMDLMSIDGFNARGAAAGGNVLTITLTETGFGPATGTILTGTSGAQSRGSAIFTTSANGASLTSSGTLGSGPFSALDSGALTGYSGPLTETVVLTANGPEVVSFNFDLGMTGTSSNPAPNVVSNSVPDSGMTLVLLGSSLTALGLFARLRKQVEM
jgi:hypothetical protein